MAEILLMELGSEEQDVLEENVRTPETRLLDNKFQYERCTGNCSNGMKAKSN